MACLASGTGRGLRWSERALATGPVALLLGLCIAAGAAELWKLLTIALASSGSMLIGAGLGLRALAQDRGVVWAYGLAAGAMVGSASAFLLPTAIKPDPRLGGFGIALGVLAGFAFHTLGERADSRTTLLDDIVVRLTVHGLAAGTVIGAIYTTLPEVGLLLGLSILSHKGPAGYAAARSLHSAGRSVLPLAVPACGTGIPAILLGLLGWPLSDQFNAVLFGLGAGIFLHLAIDFLPRPDRGTDAVRRVLGLPGHAVFSVAAGAGAVMVAWALVSTF